MVVGTHARPPFDSFPMTFCFYIKYFFGLISNQSRRSTSPMGDRSASTQQGALSEHSQDEAPNMTPWVRLACSLPGLMLIIWQERRGAQALAQREQLHAQNRKSFYDRNTHINHNDTFENTFGQPVNIDALPTVQTATANLDQILAPYVPTQSHNVSPMERCLTVDRTDEPFSAQNGSVMPVSGTGGAVRQSAQARFMSAVRLARQASSREERRHLRRSRSVDIGSIRKRPEMSTKGGTGPTGSAKVWLSQPSTTSSALSRRPNSI